VLPIEPVDEPVLPLVPVCPIDVPLVLELGDVEVPVADVLF